MRGTTLRYETHEHISSALNDSIPCDGNADFTRMRPVADRISRGKEQ